jgi:branched-subunit amino acid ABC-type transport system permease component
MPRGNPARFERRVSHISNLLLGIGFGLATAAIIALAAVAVSLQVSVTNFVNFAYGDYLTFGAYIAWVFNHAGVNLALAIVLSCALTGLMAVVVNQIVFKPFMDRKVRPTTLLIAGIGVSFILQNVIILAWGPSPQRFAVGLGRSIHLGPFRETPGDLVFVGGSAALLILLHLLLSRTKFGRSQRATSNNTDLAQACGINTGRVITYTWFISGVLTALAGVALVLEVGSLSPTTGFDELFIIFGAVILGGLGRPYGAMLGAVVIGIVTEVSGLYINAAYKSSLAFLVVIVILLLRPQGILPTAGKTS